MLGGFRPRFRSSRFDTARGSAVGDRRVLNALASSDIDEPNQRAGEWTEPPRDGVKGWQEHLEHALGIPPHDQQRHDMPAPDDKGNDPSEEEPKRCRTLRRGLDHDEHGRHRDCERLEQPGRNKQAYGVLEIVAEPVRPAMTLSPCSVQTKRQTHQRTEGGLDGAHIHRQTPQQEQDQRCHTGGASIPPFRRSRRSSRAI